MMIGALIYRNVLRKKAMEMVLLGERLSAGQALELGLITRSVPSERLDDEVEQILQSLAAKSPIGMKIGKEAFYAMADMPFEEAVDFLCRQNCRDRRYRRCRRRHHGIYRKAEAGVQGKVTSTAGWPKTNPEFFFAGRHWKVSA